MILDSSLLFDPQGSLLTVSRASTNVIDLVNPRDVGIFSRELYLDIQATGPWTAPAGTSLNVQYQGSVDNATWNTIIESSPYSFTAFPPGRRLLAVTLPRQFPNPDDTAAQLFRYLRLNYVVAGGPISGGGIFAGIILDPNDRVNYPKNFNITA